MQACMAVEAANSSQITISSVLLYMSYAQGVKHSGRFFAGICLIFLT